MTRATGSAAGALTLEGLARAPARRAAPRLRDLGGALAGLADPDALVARVGRVVATGADAVRIEGLGHALRPGDAIALDGVPALVKGVEKAGGAGSLRAVPDGAVRCGATARALGARPHPDASWLGRVLDARLDPLDGGAPPSPSPRERPPCGTGTSPIPLGVGALDLLCEIRAGEAWALTGPHGSARTGLIGRALAAGRTEALVHAALAPRGRDAVRLAARPHPRALSIIGTRADGRAAATAALTAAARAAAALRGDGPVLLLVDDADRVPPEILRRWVRFALVADVAVLASLDAAPPWADGSIMLDEAGEVDWAHTLAEAPSQDDGRLARIAAAIGAGARDEVASPALDALLSPSRGAAPPALAELEASLGLSAPEDR